jgi:hypothetical protein
LPVAAASVTSTARAPHNAANTAGDERVAKLSISKAWDETREVLRRDGKLLATVALALIVLPGVVQNMVAPTPVAGQLPEAGPWMIVLLVTLLIGLIGQLALVRLATGPQTTVGEAITHGARRVLVYVAVAVIVLVPLAFAIVALMLWSKKTGEAPGAALAMLVLLGLFIYLFVRFIISMAVTSAEPIGPIAVIQRTWSITRGNWWRLFGFVVLYIVAALLVMVAIGTMIGIIVGIVLGPAEPMSVAALLITLVTQIAVSAVTVVFVVMIARMYLQLAHHGAEASVPSSGT